MSRSYAKPEIVSQYEDNEGQYWYVLDNGRATKKEVYDDIWNPPKGKVLPKGTKDETVLFTTRNFRIK